MKKVHIFIQKAMEDQQTIWPGRGARDKERKQDEKPDGKHNEAPDKSSAEGLSKELPAGQAKPKQEQCQATAMGLKPSLAGGATAQLLPS